MKTAEQWYADGGLNDDAAEIQHRREIQADAMRYAADICQTQRERMDAEGGHANRGVFNCQKAIRAAAKSLNAK